MFNKNIEKGFQGAVFHLCQQALVPLLRNDEAQMQRSLFIARENRQSTYSFSFLQSYIQF